jgi:hypothetical protein
LSARLLLYVSGVSFQVHDVWRLKCDVLSVQRTVSVHGTAPGGFDSAVLFDVEKTIPEVGGRVQRIARARGRLIRRGQLADLARAIRHLDASGFGLRQPRFAGTAHCQAPAGSGTRERYSNARRHAPQFQAVRIASGQGTLARHRGK